MIFNKSLSLYNISIYIIYRKYRIIYIMADEDINNEVATELPPETKIEAVEEPIKVEEPTKNKLKPKK